MAERPDQLCRRCAKPVTENDDWMGVERLAFHKRCFTCAKCAAPLTENMVCVQRDGRLACERCADAGAVRTAVDMSRASTARAPRSHAPHAPSSHAPDTAGGARCASCERALHRRAKVTVRSKNAYCTGCYKCHNCRRAIGDAAGCFELLDELFCVDCELEFRNKRYLLARMGCGPPGIHLSA